MLRRLLTHTLRYSASSLLVTIAGFASFPIFTRVFTVEQYGMVGYVSSLLTFLTVFGKLGLQHSIVRFHASVKAGKRDIDEPSYIRTVLVSMALVGVAAAALGSVLVELLPPDVLPTHLAPMVLLSALWLVPLRSLDSAVNNLLRAQQRSGLLSLYTVLRRYTVLGVVLGAVLTVQTSLLSFFVATLLAEGLVTLWMVARLLREVRQPVAREGKGDGMGEGEGVQASPARADGPMLRSMLLFGLPMIAYEFSATVLNLSDRFLLERLRGAQELGLYAAAYNMCEYAAVILIASLAQASTPMAVKLWEEQGPAATAAFIGRALHVYLLAAGLLLSLGAALATDALAVLASAAYRGGAVVVPAVLAGLLLNGCEPLLAVGLQIRKRTGVRVLLMSFSALLNIGLNLIFIPLWGLQGAALGTLISFGVFLSAATYQGRRLVWVDVPWELLIKLGLIGFLTFEAVSWLRGDNPWLNLLVGPPVGVAVYALLLLLLDEHSRSLLPRLLGPVVQRVCGPRVAARLGRMASQPDPSPG
jgi:O-antigen/teichoic acid export membrane protein